VLQFIGAGAEKKTGRERSAAGSLSEFAGAAFAAGKTFSWS